MFGARREARLADSKGQALRECTRWAAGILDAHSPRAVHEVLCLIRMAFLALLQPTGISAHVSDADAPENA